MSDEEKKGFTVSYSDTFLQALDEMTRDMTPEELAELEESLARFKKACEDGSILEVSEPVDMEQLRKEDPEAYEVLARALEEGPPTTSEEN